MNKSRSRCICKSYVLYVLSMICLVFVIYEYYLKYNYILNDPRKIKDIITSFGRYGVILFFLLEIIQVIIFFIPGEFMQIAAGYIYGPIWGSVISILGITIGGMLAYILSRVYGKAFVDIIISTKKSKTFQKSLNSDRICLLVFLFYLIPGIPKDVLCYLCGLSNIGLKNFLLYSTLGRLPGIVVSAYYGFKVYLGDKSIVAGISIIISLAFIIGIYKGKEIISKFTDDISSTHHNK